MKSCSTIGRSDTYTEVDLERERDPCAEMVRLKSRYLLCEVRVSDPASLQLLDEQTVYSAVKRAVCRAHGDYGAALSSIFFGVKYLNALTGVVFLRCRRSCYRIIWSALAFITTLENRGRKVQCFFNCLHVGGTIRTCQKFLIHYNTQQLHRMLPQCRSEAERLEVRKVLLSCSLNPDEDVDDEELEGVAE